ncbi:MAG TPA: hypothetical protein VFD84_02790 [Candidatus Binatia bacterium]|jgi:hypothetical protein|nr:hypothetical protein [Candidatus Binatia bacterium]
MTHLVRTATLAALAALAVTVPSVAAFAADDAGQIVTPQRMEDVAAVRDVSVADGQVSGMVENRTPDTLRDVRLRIHSLWLWKREFRPGEDDRSRVDYYVLPQEIPPHGTARFTAPAAVTSHADGRYETHVTVADVTVVATPGGAPGAGTSGGAGGPAASPSAP